MKNNGIGRLVTAGIVGTLIGNIVTLGIGCATAVMYKKKGNAHFLQKMSAEVKTMGKENADSEEEKENG